ncbi:MAG: hypothetical protein LBH03_06880 [Holophagales bacterium]|jgi:hypothetical protein|nr:hypothetical protein [Holophagales bacterium]
MEVIANPRSASAPYAPPPLAVVRNLLTGNELHQNMLRSGVAYHSVDLQNLMVLQVARMSSR